MPKKPQHPAVCGTEECIAHQPPPHWHAPLDQNQTWKAAKRFTHSCFKGLVEAEIIKMRWKWVERHSWEMHRNVTLMDLSNQYVHEIFLEDSWHYTQIFVCTVSVKSFQEESRLSATNLGLYSERQRRQCQCLQPGNPHFSHSRAQRFYINIAARGQQERSGTSWALWHEEEVISTPGIKACTCMWS